MILLMNEIEIELKIFVCFLLLRLYVLSYKFIQFLKNFYYLITEFKLSVVSLFVNLLLR